MIRTGSIVAVLLALTGVVFVGQGLGIIVSSSFMTGDPRWAFIGAAMIAAAIGILLVNRRREGGPR